MEKSIFSKKLEKYGLESLATESQSGVEHKYDLDQGNTEELLSSLYKCKEKFCTEERENKLSDHQEVSCKNSEITFGSNSANISIPQNKFKLKLRNKLRGSEFKINLLDY
jgi:hypothetical protein